MYPLKRLEWFGFACPCHESEVEYEARMALIALGGDEPLPIDIGTVQIVDAPQPYFQIISIRSTAAGPVDSSTKDTLNQLRPALVVVNGDETNHYDCSIVRRIQTSPETKLISIPWNEIESVELCPNDDIALYGLDGTILAKFGLAPNTSHCSYCWSCLGGTTTTTHEQQLSNVEVLRYWKALLRWDTERREQLEEIYERQQAQERLEQERQRLMQT